MNDKKDNKNYYTIPEYLENEIAAEARSEYHSGYIRAMAGGTKAHGQITCNTTTALNNAIDKQNKNCNVFSSDVKVFIEKSNSFVYPDATIVCGEEETSEEDDEAITNPILIIEVLSDSTKEYDKKGKFRKYCSLPSFREYVLISQEEHVVEVRTKGAPTAKGEAANWKMITTIGLEKSITLHSIGLTIKMQDIYKRVKLTKKKTKRHSLLLTDSPVISDESEDNYIYHYRNK